MATAFHLRPVSRSTTSPSPSTSTISDRTSSPNQDTKAAGMASPQARPRRPFSPSSIRELDLSPIHNMAPRKYPAPPTGHELMALFPPKPPVVMGNAGSTSGFFLAEERAFFAKGGNEMVRVRIEVDMPREGEPDTFMKPALRAAPRQWTSPSQPHSPQTSPHESKPSMSIPPQHNSTRASRNVTVTTQPVFPIVSHGTPQTPYTPHLHSSPTGPHAAFPVRTSPTERHLPSVGVVPMETDEFRDDPDEAWRRPMPHNQRRRAGKHTKRVVVK